MRQVIPFSKEVVFKTNIASITSISLEHEEKIFDGEISGDFIVFGDYKTHNDTTEKELFKYRLPFTTLIPENIKKDTIKVDIENFTYDQIEEDVLKVNIDFSIAGEELEERVEVVNEEETVFMDFDEEKLNREIDELLGKKEEVSLEEKIEETVESTKEEIDKADDEIREEIVEEVPIVIEDKDLVDIKVQEKNQVERDITEKVVEIKESITEEKEEYVTYHIHIVKESETLEQIIKLYETNLETIKLYNDVDKIKMGDKLIIPEYLDE